MPRTTDSQKQCEGAALALPAAHQRSEPEEHAFRIGYNDCRHGLPLMNPFRVHEQGKRAYHAGYNLALQHRAEGRWAR